MYLLPQPKEWNLTDGTFELSYDGMIQLERRSSITMRNHARMLQKAVQEETGMELNVTVGDWPDAAINFCTDSELGEQEYRILVQETGIRIFASCETGMFYGIQSLIQILKQAGAAIPFMEIHDAPDFPVRGLYYDVTRSRIPTMEYLKHYIDRLAAYKINHFQLYIEHTYLFRGLSEVWRDDTPLTAQEILELDRYCLERHIELVPSIATFGHLYKVLRTKSFRHLCELPEIVDEPFSLVDRMEHHTLDASNPGSLEFAKQLISEYMDLFTTNKFNLCGDETFDLGKGRSRSLAEKIGLQNMYVQFVKELCEFLVENGKVPMFWGDIICKSPELVRELPKETICLNWGYEPDQTDEAIRQLAEAGAVQYCCPGVRGWAQLVNQFRESYDNIRLMCTYAGQYGAQGVLTTDWGDCGHINHPDFGIPGMIYGAAFSWNRNILPFEAINREISRLEYGDRTEQFVDIAAKISNQWGYTWRDIIDYKEHGTGKIAGTEAAEIEIHIDALKKIKKELCMIVPELNQDQKKLVQEYLTAIDGMIQFQLVGDTVHRMRCGSSVTKDVRMCTASGFETWFYYFKREWRKVSREAELAQLQDVINWYADLLREG